MKGLSYMEQRPHSEKEISHGFTRMTQIQKEREATAIPNCIELLIRQA